MAHDEQSVQRRLLEWADRAEIAHIAQSWGLWRDDGDWERLRAAFAPEGRMATTWTVASADDFVRQCADMRENSPFKGQHFASPSVIRIKGDRAIADTRQILFVRVTIDGVEVDVTCLGRAHDRFQRLPEGWRILERVGVYERDRIDPVTPGGELLIKAPQLARFPQGYRYLGYAQERAGGNARTDLATAGSPEHERIVAASAEWLACEDVQDGESA